MVYLKCEKSSFIYPNDLDNFLKVENGEKTDLFEYKNSNTGGRKDKN